MADLLERLKQRKLVQWALAYAGGAWFVLQLLEIIAGTWNLPSALSQIVQVLVGLGLVATLVIAWYHGERGQQQVSGIELVILAALLTIGGVAVAYLRPEVALTATGPESATIPPAARTDTDAGASRTLVRIGILEPESAAPPEDSTVSLPLLQHLVTNEFARVPGVAIMDPLSLNTLLAQDGTGEPYRILRRAGLDFAARITLTPPPDSRASFLWSAHRPGTLSDGPPSGSSPPLP
jgi:hypothetical protein